MAMLQNFLNFQWLLLGPLLFLFLISMIQCLQRSSSTLSIPTTTFSMFKCNAAMEPSDIIVKRFDLNDENLANLKIRCVSTFPEEGFSNPVFDLSCGDLSNTGLYIVRGKSECQDNNTRCESEFLLPSLALKDLLYPDQSTNKNGVLETPNGMNHLKDHHQHHNNQNQQLQHQNNPSSHAIKVTCDVADKSRNSKLAVRCTATANIRFAKVLHYGQSCSLSSIDQECGRNMRCINQKCQCKKAFIDTTDKKTGQIICLEQASIGQKCLVNKQCTVLDTNSICQNDPKYPQQKTCQCSKDFQVITSQSKLLCERIQSLPESSAITVMDESILKHREKLATHYDRSNSTGTGNNSEKIRLSLTNRNIGLVVFMIVLFWVIIIAVIFVRLSRSKTNTIITERNNESNNGNSNQTNDQKSIKTLGYKLQPEEEDLEFIFDDGLEKVRRNPIIINNEIDNIKPSPLLNNRSPSNFDINAKQSVV